MNRVKVGVGAACGGCSDAGVRCSARAPLPGGGGASAAARVAARTFLLLLLATIPAGVQ